MYEVNYTPQLSGNSPKYIMLVQHLKDNKCNQLNQQAKEEKSFDHINRCRKAFEKLQHSFMI